MKKKRIVVTFHNRKVIDYLESLRRGQVSIVVEVALSQLMKSDIGQTLSETLKSQNTNTQQQ